MHPQVGLRDPQRPVRGVHAGLSDCETTQAIGFAPDGFSIVHDCTRKTSL
jgi:hypothetical protein